MRGRAFFLVAAVALAAALAYRTSHISSRSVPAAPKSNAQERQVFMEVTSSEYEAAREVFLNIVREHNPAAALARLRESVKTNAGLLRSCHPLVHEIGHTAHEKYRDFGAAMRYQDEICNSGYLHGVIESHFLGSLDSVSAMKKVCDPYRKGTFMRWQCYHGIGHGAMLSTSNDLPNALLLCDSYEDAVARSTCVNGVFMENFNTDQKEHPSAYLDDSDLFYPCAEQKIAHKADCYLYAPTHYLSINVNDYEGALTWCNKAEFLYRINCAQGVGSQAMKENILAPALVENVCARANLGYVGPCITGMVNMYINHYGALEPARELCGRMKAWSKDACLSATRSREGQFQNS